MPNEQTICTCGYTTLKHSGLGLGLVNSLGNGAGLSLYNSKRAMLLPSQPTEGAMKQSKLLKSLSVTTLCFSFGFAWHRPTCPVSTSASASASGVALCQFTTHPNNRDTSAFRLASGRATQFAIATKPTNQPTDSIPSRSRLPPSYYINPIFPNGRMLSTRSSSSPSFSSSSPRYTRIQKAFDFGPGALKRKDMSRDDDSGDASGSRGRSDRVAAAQGAMPAAHDDSTTPQLSSVKAGDIDTETPASMPQSQPETSRRHEIAGGTSTPEAASCQGAAPMTSMPGADSVLVRYPGLRTGVELGTVPMEMLSGATDIVFRDIWNDEVSEAFRGIEAELQSGDCRWRLLGFDTEFCRLDGTVDPFVPPTSAEHHYQQARRIVDRGNLVQVGIAIGDIGGPCRAVYQFNLQFDPASRDTTSRNIAFLRDTAKLDLDRHCTRGIDPSTFFEHLTASGLLSNTSISWITYQGYADFGYLIRGLENSAVLPVDRRQFLVRVKKYFPRLVDLKIFHMSGICCNEPVPGIRGSGSFQFMASALGVKRLGNAHGAGSDAHLTLLCYNAMVVSNPLAALQLSEYRNIVYGVGEAIPCPCLHEDSETSHVEVRANNWELESKLITDMFETNTCAAVVLQTSFGDELRSTALIPYDAARMLIESLPGPVKLGFAILDRYGRICFGRMWILNLQGTRKDPSHIRHHQLATVLTQASALCNDRISWCSSSSFAHMCLLKALTTARCLPTSLQGLYQVHSAFFPNSRIVWLPTTEKREGPRSLDTLLFFMHNPALAWPVFSDFC